MKSDKRSIRRHHYKRLKKKCSKYLSWSWGLENEEIDSRTLGKIIATPQWCSRMCCANERQFGGKTIKEKEYLKVTEEDLQNYLYNEDNYDFK